MCAVCLFCVPLQAAQYGRVFVMLFMPALRCVSKAIITTNLPLLSRFQDDLTRLRISAAAHVVIAAIILIVCLLLVTYVVPKEVAVMNQVEPLNVPPGGLVPCTAVCSHCCDAGWSVWYRWPGCAAQRC